MSSFGSALRDSSFSVMMGSGTACRQYASRLDNSNHTDADRSLLPIWTLLHCQNAQEIVRYPPACACSRTAGPPLSPPVGKPAFLYQRARKMPVLIRWVQARNAPQDKKIESADVALEQSALLRKGVINPLPRRATSDAPSMNLTERYHCELQFDVLNYFHISFRPILIS